MIRRMISALLALCMVMTILPAAVSAETTEAASGKCGESLTWTLDNGTLTVSGEGAMDDYSYQGAPWYPYRESILRLVLEEGVTSLGDYSFYACSNLMDVMLPESLERIGVVALASTAMRTVYIPSGVTEIGAEAFQGNSSMSYFSVSEDNTAFSNDDEGVLFNKDKTQLLRCPQSLEDAYVIPGTVGLVGEKAFSDCQYLTEVTMPGSVKELGRHAFSACTALETVRLREGLEVIGNEAFILCSALQGSLTIPASVTKLGNSAFDMTELTEIRFLSDMPEIGAYAFAGIALTVYYPADNATWTAEKIEACKGISTWVPYDPAAEGASGKCGDNISWVLTFDGTLTVSGEGAIENISSGEYPWTEYAEQIRKVIFEDGVTNVPDYAFDFYPNLESAELRAVEIIGYCAFDGCGRLTSVTLPETLTEIKNGAFSQTGLTSVDFPKSLTILGSSVFHESALTSVVLHEGLVSIGNDTFYGCTDLKSAVLPDSVTEIGMYLFGRCTSLETANIPSGLEYVPDMMFDGCTSLKSIVIPDGIEAMHMTNFANSGLTSVTIPASITRMGSSFMNCADLTEIIFIGSAPDISEICFENVTATAYYPLGNETWTSDVMLDYGGDITWVGYAPHEDAVKFVGASLSLKGDIGLKFYYELSDAIRADSTAYVKFTGLQEPRTVSLDTGSYDSSDNSYGFSVPLNVKNMGTQVTAQVHNAAGPVGEAKTLSIKTYADYFIANSSKQTLVDLMKAMLNYGAAAQVEFGHEVDKLVNGDMSAADRALPATVDVSAYASSLSGREDGISITSASLLLQSETKIRVYFKLAAGKSISDYTFSVDGKTVTPVASGDEYYIEKTNVAAKDLDTMYAFKMGGLTLNYCGLSYVNVVQKYSSDDTNLMNLVKALYCYNQAANAYFGK